MRGLTRFVGGRQRGSFRQAFGSLRGCGGSQRHGDTRPHQDNLLADDLNLEGLCLGVQRVHDDLRLLSPTICRNRPINFLDSREFRGGRNIESLTPVEEPWIAAPLDTTQAP